MESTHRRLFISADAPEALVRLCGVTMLDRVLRTLQRAGFDHATVLTTTPDAIARELAKPSWARAAMRVKTRVWTKTSFTFGDPDDAGEWPDSSNVLLISGGSYFDPRLMEALVACQESTALVDSDLEQPARRLVRTVKQTRCGYLCGAFLLKTDFIHAQLPSANVFDGLAEQINAGKLATLDVAALSPFVVSMRRNIRPLWFPAPDKSTHAAAEGFVLDTVQKGAMEVISYLETPVENWLLRWLWNTSITPMQITLFGLIVGIATTVAILYGHLWTGALLALSIGVIDGLDGKQARVKVETTKLGRWEGEMDYPVQMSWWISLAYYFSHANPQSHAISWVVLFLVADIVDKIFTRQVKLATGRHLDNYAAIDGVVRFFAGPRSLYVCMLLLGLCVGQPYRAWVLICCWHATVAVIHGIRAAWICPRYRRPLPSMPANDITQ